MSNLKRLPGGLFAVSPCPICGKTKTLAVIVNVEHYLYQDHKREGNTYYCSYTCWREAERREKAKKEAREQAKLQRITEKQRKRRVLSEEAVKALEETRQYNIHYLGKLFWEERMGGMTLVKIAEKYGKSLSFVKKWSSMYRQVVLEATSAS